MTVLIGILVSVLCVYAGVLAMLYFTQRSLMYFPGNHPHHAGRGRPAAGRRGHADHVRRRAHHRLARAAARRQAGHSLFPRQRRRVALSRRALTRLITDGIGIVAVEYRGYGGSAAARASAASSPTPKPVTPSPRRAIRRSRSCSGASRSAPASRSRWRRKNRSAASSWKRRSRRPRRSAPALLVVPVRLLMTDQFRSDQRIGKVTAPLLILHGVQGPHRPYRDGRADVRTRRQAQAYRAFPRRRPRRPRQNGALVAWRFLPGIWIRPSFRCRERRIPKCRVALCVVIKLQIPSRLGSTPE